jgi:hypothetical protein
MPSQKRFHYHKELFKTKEAVQFLTLALWWVTTLLLLLPVTV